MMKLGILTISDTRTQGTRRDTATARLRQLVEEAGGVVAHTALVSDERDQIQAHLIEMADQRALPLVLTTGGTGLGPRDVTPEATRGVIDCEVPGLAEAMRAATATITPLAWLSRAIAGRRHRTLIVNLPGNPQGAEECLRVLWPLLPHAVDMIKGASHGSHAAVVADP